MNYHALPVEKALKALKTDSQKGLSEEEALLRQKKYGKNQLPEEKIPSKIEIFLRQFKNPLILILVSAGLVTFAIRHFTDSLVIFLAIILATIFGFFQENKASRILHELKKLAKRERAIVIRDDHQKEIGAENLVPGDIVLLQAGDKVPADGRIIETFQLKINEAVLTGEWLGIEKNADTLPENTILAERKNMAHLGTVVEEGRGKIIVTATGLETEFGKIALIIQKEPEVKTPYQKKLAYFSKVIGIVILSLVSGIFVFGILTGKDPLEMFLTSVSVAVAGIPEGLPVAMTIVLALGMQRILKKKGLLRNLVSAETLGSTTIIATDKTGTLTEAKMQVAGLFTGQKELLSDGKKYAQKLDKDGMESHIFLLKIATLCNEAFIENPEDELHRWRVRGRPTEKALLMAGIQAGFSKKELEEREPKIDELPFDPLYKYTATLHKISEEEFAVYMLGAPEIIMAHCKYFDADGKMENLTESKISGFQKKMDDLTSQGMRVLAASFRKLKKEEFGEKFKDAANHKDQKFKLYEELLKDMIFVGFISLRDPLRPTVKEAIRTCQNAGIRIIIVTGDYKLTAKAVAKELSLPSEAKNIIEGKDLDVISDEELEKRVRDFSIYARVEPRQKLRIVKAWQKKGEVIAMTGDGVNDAPALKSADIGLALGSGTAVAKEASDLILITDDFSIIEAAIEEGRTIVDNIRKVIVFLFSGGFTELILIGVSVILHLPLPLLPAQILWINLVEDGLPATALSFERREKDVMSRKPESIKAPLLNSQMKVLIFIIGLFTDLLLLGLFLWLLNMKLPLFEIRTIIFTALAIDSLFYIFSCKSLRKNIWQINIFSNKMLIGAWLFGVIMLLGALYLPPLQILLKTQPLTLLGWALVASLGFINLLLIELTKWYFIAKRKI